MEFKTQVNEVTVTINNTETIYCVPEYQYYNKLGFFPELIKAHSIFKNTFEIERHMCLKGFKVYSK